MSEETRFRATLERERFWSIHDTVPTDQLGPGCDYCVGGWATGPGLVYRCDNCNPGKEGEPHLYHMIEMRRPSPAEPRAGFWSSVRNFLRL